MDKAKMPSAIWRVPYSAEGACGFSALHELTDIYSIYTRMEAAMDEIKTAKIFMNGKSQAVRLPKEFRFDDDEVVIKKEGSLVFLIPKRYRAADLLELAREIGPVDLGEREQPEWTDRREED